MATCGRCGGSRRVREPETDPRTGKTVWRTKVCPVCNGRGTV